MDPQQANQLVAKHLDAEQTWDRTQVLMAEAAALCAAALEACGRTEELRLQPPIVPPS